MKGSGIILMMVGAIVVLVAFLLPTSVETYSSGGLYGLPERMLNLGKLQTQTLVFAAGAVLFLAGAIFVAAGEVANRVDLLGGRLPDAPKAPVTAPAAEGPADPSKVHRWDEHNPPAADLDFGTKMTLFGAVALLIIGAVAWGIASSQENRAAPSAGASTNVLDVVPTEALEDPALNIDAPNPD